MSRYLYLARNRELASSGPLRGPSLVSGKDRHKSLSARAAAELLRYDWARPEPAIDQDEFFDDQFERRAHEIQRTPSGQNALSIVPQKTGPWTGFNQLGQEKAFAPDANNRQTILKLDEWGFPERWTVMLGSTYDLPSDSNDEQTWSARAEVTVGSGGAIQTFEVDWMEGTVFPVVANAILINARYNNFDVYQPINLRLRATVCRGAAQGGTLPTITETAIAAAGASSEGVRVPPFARAFSIFNTTGTVAGVFDALTQIRFSSSEAPIVANGRINGAQVLSMGNRVPMPAMTRFLILTNGTGADISARIIFHIEP